MGNQTHITFTTEQFNLLMGEIRDLKNENKELRKEVSTIREELKPAIKFFKEEPEPPKTITKRLSSKQKSEQRAEERYRLLEQQSLERIKEKANMS